MEQIELKAVVRPTDKTAQALRNSGFVPAELYGHGLKNLHLAVSQNEFEKVLRKAGESTIVSLNVESAGAHNVLIHAVQRHPVKNEPTHADFYEVKMTEKLKTNVQLEYVGESTAVKLLGGTLVKMLSEVEIEALPADLPHSLSVDISSLKSFDDILEVRHIPLPKGVVVLTNPDEAVAKVQPPRDVEADLAAPVEEDVTKVEGVVKEEESTDDTAEKAKAE